MNEQTPKFHPWFHKFVVWFALWAYAAFAVIADSSRAAMQAIERNARGVLKDDLDARVLDLFGGTGALALEALSRGAESAVIVDNSRQAQQAIDRNARGVLKDDFEYRARILHMDYRSAIGALEGRMFDLVFLDPPYRMVEAYGDALSLLAKADMLAPGCLIVMERRKDAEVALPEAFRVTDGALEPQSC